VHGLPVAVGEACSGINVLQSMLIAGSALACLYLGKRRSFWPNVAALPAMAWLANALRIFILCMAALTAGRDFALGMFHAWGGWLVLFLMLVLSWGLLALQASLPGRPDAAGPP
jgi:exosortase/archaeosortase family protein